MAYKLLRMRFPRQNITLSPRPETSFCDIAVGRGNIKHKSVFKVHSLLLRIAG